MEKSSEKGEQFWAPLHGLRGIAVLYVLISHMGNSGLTLLPFPHNGIGKVGVWIFFVLSAFLLTNRLLDSLNRGRPATRTIAAYFVSRFFRIYPLYVVVLILHVADHHMGVRGFFMHLALLAGMDELWAIPVEFKFYFVIPLIVLLAHTVSRSAAIIAVTVLAVASQWVALQSPAEVYSNGIGLAPKALPFLLGALLALSWKEGDASADRGSWLSGGVAGLLLAAMVGVTVMFREIQIKALPVELAPWNSLALALIVVGLVFMSFRQGPLKTVLGSRPLVFVGEISFSMYLLHMFIVAPSHRIEFIPAGVKAWLVLLAVFVCGYVSHELIEKRGIALGKRIIARRVMGSSGRSYAAEAAK